jgi:hypothetical protein
MPKDMEMGEGLGGDFTSVIEMIYAATELRQQGQS